MRLSHDPAPALSAWVADALRLKVEHDRRRAALARLVEDYEAEHGEITEDLAALALAARLQIDLVPV